MEQLWQFHVTAHLTQEKIQDAPITQRSLKMPLRAQTAKNQPHPTEFVPIVDFMLEGR